MKPIRNPLLLALGLTVLLGASLSMAADGSSSQPPAAEPSEQPADLGGQEQLFVPEPQPRLECITCEGNYTTAVDWAMGASCAEAQSNLLNQLTQTASSFCVGIGSGGACDKQLEVTGACRSIGGGQYKIDGRLHHGCREGDIFCPKW